jgi:hypothetical protein
LNSDATATQAERACDKLHFLHHLNSDATATKAERACDKLHFLWTATHRRQKTSSVDTQAGNSATGIQCKIAGCAGAE